VPSIVLRVAVGDEMTSEFLVASQRARPERLLSSGIVFADPALPGALVTALQDR
jgi:NAD dependent epimerase/dehydratase family enzyme